MASSADRPRDALEGDDLFLGGPGEILARTIDLALALEQLAGTLLEHVGALVELFVPLEETPFERGELAAACPCLVLGLALEAQLLVLGFEDQFLLAGPCLGFDAAAFGRCGLHRLRRPDAAQENAEYGSAGGGHEGHHHDDLDLHLTPPIRPAIVAAGRFYSVVTAGSPARDVGGDA